MWCLETIVLMNAAPEAWNQRYTEDGKRRLQEASQQIVNENKDEKKMRAA